MIHSPNKWAAADVRELADKSIVAHSKRLKVHGHPNPVTGANVAVHDLTPDEVVPTCKYVVKDVLDHRKHSYPPRSFKGNVVLFSRRYLSAPVPDLWTEVRAEWFGGMARKAA